MTPQPAHARLTRLATCYDGEESDDDTIQFELPEDLTALADEELAELRDRCVEAFDALYAADDADLTADDVEAMQQLADAADAIRAEENRRTEEREQNRQTAEELAARVRPEDAEGEGEEGDGSAEAEGGTEGGEEGDGAETADEPEPAPVMASGQQQRPGPISVTLSGVRGRQRAPAPREDGEARPALLASADLGGDLTSGQEISIAEAARAISRKAAGINEGAYNQAWQQQRRLTQSFAVASVRKQFDQALVASDVDAQSALTAATDESRLPGGSLVAAGGWCSPSETLYDLFELESTDGLVSVPEINVARGGVRWTRGPDFQSLFADQGFSFTEAEDEDGLYAADGTAGDKPCFRVPCPSFVEERLAVDGLCITAGILANRAYPEVTERTVRGALVGHQHRLAAKIINAMIGGSTAVAMPSNPAGAVAPLLSAIELQVEHTRYTHRAPRGTTLEAIFPFWLRGLVRADLSRRLGVDLFDVSNQRIGQWFADRGVAPQWVYNYQDLTGAADGQTAWPTEARFLLYPAGTWARGSSDLVTMEAVFDSQLMRQNDFSALFTEEGWLAARLGHDSREVTVPLCSDGATHGGVDIACDGSLTS